MQRAVVVSFELYDVKIGVGRTAEPLQAHRLDQLGIKAGLLPAGLLPSAGVQHGLPGLLVRGDGSDVTIGALIQVPQEKAQAAQFHGLWKRHEHGAFWLRLHVVLGVAGAAIVISSVSIDKNRCVSASAGHRAQRSEQQVAARAAPARRR